MNLTEILSLPENEKISRLIDALSHEDWLIRKESHQLLIEIGESVASPLYGRLMDTDCDKDTLYWGVLILTELGETGLKGLIHLYEKQKNNPDILSRILRSFARYPSERVIDILINELGNSRWIIRQDASSSLLQIGKISVPKLKKAFNHGNKDIRYWTVKIIGQMLGQQAIDPFMKLLQSESNDLRYYAVTALGEIESETAVDAIIKAFSDDSWLVRSQAADILEKMGKKVTKKLATAFTTNSTDANTRYWSLKTLTKIIGADAIDLVMNSISADETDLRFHFIASLQEIENQQAIDLLVQWLDDPTWLIRKTAANALGKIGSKAVPTLSNVLVDSTNENIRYWVVRILSKMGEEGLTPLLNIIDKSEKREKLFIIRALANIESDRVIKPLLSLLKDDSWTVRQTAAETLGSINPRIFIRMIAEHMDYQCQDMTYWVRSILREQQHLYEDTIERFLESNELEKTHLYHLLAFGATDIYVDLLIKVLREGNLAIREELEKCFAGFGDEDLVKLLLKKLDNVTSEVAFWLYRLIISTGKSTAAIIIKQISDSSSDKLIWLTKIMGELKDDAFVQPLLSFLSNSNKNVRYEATKVISKFSGDILSKELLEIYLNEDEEGRIAIIENFKALSSQEMLETLSTKLNDASEKHAYWIAKLLAETAKESLDFFKQQEKTASKTDKTSYWMKRIIEHIEGKSYL